MYCTYGAFARGMEPVSADHRGRRGTQLAARLPSIAVPRSIHTLTRAARVPSCPLCPERRQTSCVWGFLDMLPRGRDEKTGMDWVKHAQEY